MERPGSDSRSENRSGHPSLLEREPDRRERKERRESEIRSDRPSFANRVSVALGREKGQKAHRGSEFLRLFCLLLSLGLHLCIYMNRTDT